MPLWKKLATKTIAANVGTKQALYTGRVGKKCIVTAIVVRSASASLASNAGTLKFGANAPADDWGNTITDLTGLTGSTKAIMKNLASPAVIINGGDVFGAIFSSTGVTANVVVDIFGYLY